MGRESITGPRDVNTVIPLRQLAADLEKSVGATIMQAREVSHSLVGPPARSPMPGAPDCDPVIGQARSESILSCLERAYSGLVELSGILEGLRTNLD